LVVAAAANALEVALEVALDSVVVGALAEAALALDDAVEPAVALLHAEKVIATARPTPAMDRIRGMTFPRGRV